MSTCFAPADSSPLPLAGLFVLAGGGDVSTRVVGSAFEAAVALGGDQAGEGAAGGEQLIDELGVEVAVGLPVLLAAATHRTVHQPRHRGDEDHHGEGDRPPTRHG